MKRISFLLVLFSCCTVLSAQSDAYKRLATYAAHIGYFNQLCPQEKVYLHLNNTAYFQGDTILYSANMVGQSKVLYVDLLSPDGVLLQQQKLKVEEGRTDGSIVLAKKIKINSKEVNMLYPSGSYQLRAYTRSMLINGAEVFSSVVSIRRKAEKDVSSASLLSAEIDGEPSIAFTSEAGNHPKGENRGAAEAADGGGVCIVEDGLMLDGWVVNKEDRPQEGVVVKAIIGDDKRFAECKLTMTTDSKGYWCLPMNDFIGICPVSLSLERKRHKDDHSRRIVVRQFMSSDVQPSQLKEYVAFRDKSFESLSNEKRQSTANYIHYFNVMNEHSRRLDLGLSSISVADLLTEKGLETSVDFAAVSYEPNQPLNESFYSEPDYGNIDASIGRMQQTDGMRFRNSTPSHVVRGTYVNGHPARWNIKVPRNFPSKIYDREITYTWDTDIKYVKSVFIVDYEPEKHPFVEVRVELRAAEEIGVNTPSRRTLPFVGYSTPAEW